MPRDMTILLRGGTEVEWSTANPVLEFREVGVETDTRKMKVGDGSTAWNSLAYSNGDQKQDALISGTNIKTINGSSVLGSGDLAVTAAPLTVIAGTNAAVTMLVNRHYELDGSILTADRNYDLPVPSAVGDRIRVSLTNGNASWECIIRGTTGITVNGGSAGAEWSRLFIAREYAEFRATSVTNWDVWDDGRIPQVAEMTLASSISNHFANNAYTKVPFDTVGVNVGSIANTSTDEFVVRRAGNYAVWLDAYLTSMATVATNIILTAFTSSRLFLGDEQTTIMVPAKLNLGSREVGLAAGGSVYFECYHNNGGPRAAGTLCRARIREML